DHEQVAGRATVRTGGAAPLHADALAVGHAGRHAHLHLASPHLDTTPVTCRARGRDHLPAPATRRAHLRERERSLIDGDRTTAVTLGTGFRARSRRGPRAAARRARRVGAKPHRAGDAAYGVFERKMQLG